MSNSAVEMESRGGTSAPTASLLNDSVSEFLSDCEIPQSEGKNLSFTSQSERK